MEYPQANMPLPERLRNLGGHGSTRRPAAFEQPAVSLPSLRTSGLLDVTYARQQHSSDPDHVPARRLLPPPALDGAYGCWNCGTNVPPREASFHHVPQETNPVALCVNCHSHVRLQSGQSSYASSVRPSDDESEQMGCTSPALSDSVSLMKVSDLLTNEPHMSKRRRSDDSDSTAVEPLGEPQTKRDRPAEPRSLAKVEKKYKEKKSRDSQKGFLQHMEEFVLKYRSLDGFTKLNHNNSRASGLTIKKGEVLEHAVIIMKHLEAQEERQNLEIMQLQRELEYYKANTGVQRWMAGCSSATPPDSPVTRTSMHDRRRNNKL